MKEKLSGFWVRFAAYLVCTISMVGLVASVLSMILYSVIGTREDAVKMGFEHIAENYSAYIMTNFQRDEEMVMTQMAKTNFYYAVVKDDTSEEEEVDLYDRENYVFTNLPENPEELGESFEFTYELEGNPDVWMHYNIKNFMAALSNTYYYGDYEYTCASINGVIFDMSDGIFYMDTAAGYFPVKYLSVNEDGLQYDYKLRQTTEGNAYVNTYYGRTLDPSAYENWSYVKIEINEYYQDSADGISGLTVISDNSAIKENIHTEDWYIYDETRIMYDELPAVSYKVVGWVDEDLGEEDLFLEWQDAMAGFYRYEGHIVQLEMLFAFLFVISLVFLIWTANGQRENIKLRHKFPLLIYTGCIALIEVGLGALYVAGFEVLYSVTDVSITLKACVMLMLQLAGIVAFIFLTFVSNLTTRIKTKTLIRYSEFYYIFIPVKKLGRLLVRAFRRIRENTSLFLSVTIGMVVVDIIQFVVLSEVVWYNSDEVLGWFLLYKAIQLIVVLMLLFQMVQLQKGSERIANGDLSKPIDTSKMVWEFKRHGENINKVGEGISKAVDNQLKSERFKTELITNVSHDIKTPLTSIINYVDLIKKENITDPTLCEYVDVLDRQSSRLKKLIEDLMEASKASTGNLKVDLEECNISMLIGQAAGEFEDRFAVNGLQTIITKPEDPIYVMADGRHMWRVLDNLLNNINKYSLPFSRVYIELEQKGENAIICFKNISKTQLNISSDELMERFVRGDSSRNTEGSGLGLSIAQSLTELMNGTMKLSIDGDLFKVTLTFPVAKKLQQVDE